MTINIIDPTSVEFNRGSFCYTPYLLFNILNLEHKVNLIEAFRGEEMNKIPEADINIVCLWSYPQIEAAFLLANLLPYETGEDNVYFAGYSPLIAYLGFKNISEYFGIDYLADKDSLITAMIHYPVNYNKFQNLLLSDCDAHIKDLEKGEKVYPLFTSYGCPNGCSFCPSTFNCNQSRISLQLDEVLDMLDECYVNKVMNIHFTDEDFFYDTERAYKILKTIRGAGFNLIALGSADKVLKFINEYGTNVIWEAGLNLIEIGFESADPEMIKKMGKPKTSYACTELAELKKKGLLTFEIFWLVQTFFTGETIETLNTTGRFMQLYGLNMDEVVPRLRTNGTKGGLGQFFQPYHGTPSYKKTIKEGVLLTDRPIRLIPSYIPNSFLDSLIKCVYFHKIEGIKPWLKIYNVEDQIQLIDTIPLDKLVTIRDLIPNNLSTQIKIKRAIFFALLARMEVIL